VFRYAFEPGPNDTTVPKLLLHQLNGEAFELFGLAFTPIPLLHGKSTVFGFRFGAAAYLTDHSEIPEESKTKLRGLDVLFLDALRHRPHPTHSTVERSLGWVEELKPRRAFFTHICHDLPHQRTEAALPSHVHLAYDGLEIEVAAGGSACPTNDRMLVDQWGAGASACRIARSVAEAAGFDPSAVTIGNFDGVHAGHRYLFRQVVALAHERGVRPTVLTFDPHPARIVAPARAPRLLTTPDERVALMAESGIEQVLILPFTADVARLSPEEFVVEIVKKALRAKVVMVGDNFRFGHKQAGDTHVLTELGERYGFETQIVGAVKCRGQIVSSSEIRRLIETGDVARACRMLGRPYSLSGEVVPGQGIGSKQTVPTLNLHTQAEVLPLRGVYITRTWDLDSDRRWNSISNIGYRPTFGGDTLTIESFLLERFEEPTPKRIRVEFLRRVRDERKFESPEPLKAQILRDVRQAQTFFRRLKRVTMSAEPCQPSKQLL
jgi:riboflavin kinase/FMN adenylyltransferase